MMEKSLREIITFYSTTDAIMFEKYCRKESIEGRLIPVPRAISASCGLCWSAPEKEKERIETAVSSDKLRIAERYQMMLQVNIAEEKVIQGQSVNFVSNTWFLNTNCCLKIATSYNEKYRFHKGYGLA